MATAHPLFLGIISVGESEILHDDTAHFAGKALQAGGDVKLVVRIATLSSPPLASSSASPDSVLGLQAAPFMQHVFPYFYHFVPEADQELTQIANWVKKQQQKI